jgi:hypothetical protein
MTSLSPNPNPTPKSYLGKLKLPNVGEAHYYLCTTAPSDRQGRDLVICWVYIYDCDYI